MTVRDFCFICADSVRITLFINDDEDIPQYVVENADPRELRDSIYREEVIDRIDSTRKHHFIVFA